MPCYHPLTGYWFGEWTSNGKKKYEIVGGADPTERHPRAITQTLIPCGQCIGCRLDYSRRWADRMMLELETTPKDEDGLPLACFVTLTYDDKHLPPSELNADGSTKYGTLDKRDCQLFMKRLRARKEFEGRTIRFFLSGEYGPTTFRPHMHIILFGVGLRDFLPICEDGRINEKECLLGKNELGQPYYKSALLAEIWRNGFNLVANVNYKTCAYVARYVTKKLTGDMSIIYAERSCKPPFSLMSRNPGIGKKYLEQHPDCLDVNKIPIFDGENCRKIPIPRYYIEQLDKEMNGKEHNPLYDHEKYKELLRQRKEASDKLLLESAKTDDSFLEYLAKKEEKRKNALSGKGKKKYNTGARNKI